MTQEQTIPFVGGSKDGHRIPNSGEPPPHYKVIIPQAINLSYEASSSFDEQTTIATETYQLERVKGGSCFYRPQSAGPYEAIGLMIEKYPAKPSSAEITIPAAMLRDLIEGYGAMPTNFSPVRKAAKLYYAHLDKFGL